MFSLGCCRGQGATKGTLEKEKKNLKGGEMRVGGEAWGEAEQARGQAEKSGQREVLTPTKNHEKSLMKSTL